MTVGFSLHLPIPIIGSDCLALPSGSNKQFFSPSNIEFYDGSNGELASLVSKIVRLDENTMLSLAGNTADIQEFMENFPRLWEERDKGLRPMEFLKEIDDQLHKVRPGWACSILGISAQPEIKNGEQILINNYASLNDNWSFETENFGMCFSVGSGSQEIRSAIEKVDSRIKPEHKNRPYFFYEIVGGLNGKNFFDQRQPLSKQTWGGLIQLYHLSNDNKWINTPPWLNLCVHFEGADLKPLGLVKKHIFHTYTKDKSNTAVLIATTHDENGRYNMWSWPIHSPFDKLNRPEKIYFSNIHQKPELITITFKIFLNTDKYVINHMTFPYGDIETMFRAETDPNYTVFHTVTLCDWLRLQIRSNATMMNYINSLV